MPRVATDLDATPKGGRETERKEQEGVLECRDTVNYLHG